MADGLAKRLRGLRGEARREALLDVVSRWRGSGQSRAAFSRELGIAPVTLGRWVRRIEASRPATPAGPVLVEVGRHEGPARDGFEVVLPSAVRVHVPRGFGQEDLARLLALLSTTC